jgi:cytochrome c oxidase subunit IV
MSAHGSDSGEIHAHIIPLKNYIIVFLTLVALTALTVIASRFDFGAMNTIIAILIASIKAGLVLAIFMHLKYDDRLYLVVILTSVFFLIVMYFFSILDFVTRVDVKNIL